MSGWPASQGALAGSWVLGAGGFLFGLLIGSFLNVVIFRLPNGMSLVWPGSHCPNCDRPIRPWENIPLLSYSFLRGRCRGCGVSISLRYPLVEALVGVLFAVIALRFGLTPMLPVWMGFAAALVAAGAIDLDHQIIPDPISLGGLVCGLGLVPLVRWFEGVALAPAYAESLLGALLGGGLLWIVGFVHARISVGLGRKFAHWPGEGEEFPHPSSLDYWTWFPGIGFGDIKLLAMIGAFLGMFGVLETIFVASFLGLVLGTLSALLHRDWQLPFGFGPAIAAGALLVLISPYSLFAWIG